MAERLESLSPDVRIVFALDLFDFVSGEDRRWPGVEDVIACIAESPQRYADLHPYRNPLPPDVSPWGSRQAEHAAIAARLGHARFIYGEMGWKPSEGDIQASGAFHVTELALAAQYGVPLVGVYVHVADLGNPDYDFGLWVEEVPGSGVLTPRPAATLLSRYLAGPASADAGTLARRPFLDEQHTFPDGAVPEQILGYAWARLVGPDDALAVEHKTPDDARSYIWPDSGPPTPQPPTPAGDVLLTDWLTARWRDNEFMPDYAPLPAEDRREFRDALKAKGYNALCAWVAYFYSEDDGFNYLELPDEWAALMKEVYDDGLKAIVCIGPEGSGNDGFKEAYPPDVLAPLMRTLIQACEPWIAAVMLGPEKEEYWSRDDADQIGSAIREVTQKPIYTHDQGGTVDVDYWWCTGCAYQVIGGDPSTQQVIDEIRAAKQAARGKQVLVGETVYGACSEDLEQRAIHLGDTGIADGGADGSIQAGTPGTVPGYVPIPDPIPGDEIPADEVQFDKPDQEGALNEVRDWPITVHLRKVWRDGDTLWYDFDEPPWPTVNGVRGNLWVARLDGDQWRAEPFDYFKPNQRSKSADDFGWDGWSPDSGELLYGMVSTTARDKIENGRERSQLVAFHW
jgi:hypothetical protein